MAAQDGYWERPRVQIWGLTDEEVEQGFISNARVAAFTKIATRCWMCRWPVLILLDDALVRPTVPLCSRCFPWLGDDLPEGDLAC